MFSRRSVLILLSATLLPFPALAEGTGDLVAARKFIEDRQNSLRKQMTSAKDPKQDPGLLATFDGMLDYEHFVQESLGKHQSELSEEQRRRFGEILRKLIQNSYRKNLRKLTGFEVKYTGESQAESGVLVATVATDPKKKRPDPLRVDYVVGKRENAWRVRDIITEGVSLVRNYRRQFGRIIKRDGASKLLQKMEVQLAKLESQEK